MAEFHKAHARTYGHANPERAIEIVNVRCRAIGISGSIELPKIKGIGSEKKSNSAQARRKANCFFDNRPHQTTVYEREKLCAGETLVGPAIIVEYSATSLVPPGWRAKVDAYGQVHLSKISKTLRHDAR